MELSLYVKALVKIAFWLHIFLVIPNGKNCVAVNATSKMIMFESVPILSGSIMELAVTLQKGE